MTALADPTGLFRAEALAHRASAAAAAEPGDVLRFERRWARATFALLIGATVTGFLFVSLCTVHEYASGPAVVRIDGRRTVAAMATATVDAVEVHAGQLVKAGATLARMHGADEARELERASRELDLQIARMLRDPTDASIKQPLATLRAARDQARNAVLARTVRAEIGGRVTDVRIRPGQHINAGEVMLAIAPVGEARASLTAMLPADYRPLLRSGLPMRFELDGFRYEYADLDLVDVSAEAVGPVEVQRLLGQERADSVPLGPGAKVLVTARLPAATFSSDGRPYGYFDGLTGTAEIRVRSEPILVTLVPALRQWLPAVSLDPLRAAAAAVGRWIGGTGGAHAGA